MALFSATYKPEVRKFATAMVPNANILSLKVGGTRCPLPCR